MGILSASDECESQAGGVQVLGQQVAAGSQLRPGECQRPARLPPCYDERWTLANPFVNGVRGGDDHNHHHFSFRRFGEVNPQ